MVMILYACLLTTSPTGGQQVHVFRNRFDASIMRVAPIRIRQAHAEARPYPALRPLLGQLFQAFVPDAAVPAKLDSIDFAVFAGDTRLIVDRTGFARLNGRPGRFKVVDFELLVRRESALRDLRRSSLVRLVLSNNTAKTATVIDASGSRVMAVPPGDRQSATSWFCDHKVFGDGSHLATIDATLHKVRSATPTAEQVIARWIRGGGSHSARVAAAHLTEPDDHTLELEIVAR